MTFTVPEPIAGRGVLDLSFLLTHASHVLATRMTAAFAEIGITPREYCVLAHAMGGSYTQIELAKLADLDKTTMLNTMDYLEGRRVRAADAVARRPAGADHHGHPGGSRPGRGGARDRRPGAPRGP